MKGHRGSVISHVHCIFTKFMFMSRHCSVHLISAVRTCIYFIRCFLATPNWMKTSHPICKQTHVLKTEKKRKDWWTWRAEVHPERQKPLSYKQRALVPWRRLASIFICSPKGCDSLNNAKCVTLCVSVRRPWSTTYIYEEWSTFTRLEAFLHSGKQKCTFEESSAVFDLGWTSHTCYSLASLVFFISSSRPGWRIVSPKTKV